MLVEQVLMALLSGLAYGLTQYFKKAQKGEKFDPYKLAATEVIAVFVALSLVASGAPLNQLTLGQQFALYAGLIPLVENIIKTVVRTYQRAERPPEQPKARAES